jgi:hypothetical protein
MYARMVLNGNPGLFTLNAGVRIASKRLNKVYVSTGEKVALLEWIRWTVKFDLNS